MYVQLHVSGRISSSLKIWRGRKRENEKKGEGLTSWKTSSKRFGWKAHNESKTGVCWLTFVLQICSWSTAWSHLILLWKISMFCTVLLLRGYSFQGACVTQGFNVSSYGKCSRCCFNARLHCTADSLVQWNWFSDVTVLLSTDELHPVTSENQFHCTRLCSCPTLSKDPAYCRTGM